MLKVKLLKENKMNKKLFFFLFIIYLPTLSHSNEMFVESDKLIITEEPLKTIFIGKVYAFDKEIKLWSDKLSILYKENNNEIQIIESFGKTKLIRNNQEIVCDEMIYDLVNEKIYAVGNITLTQDKNTMKGDELSIDLIKSTSIMKSNNKNKVQVKINKIDD